MQIELDHLFVCTSPGAPEAEKLVQFGLREGPPNQHRGQGTANRRFPFANAMIELLWVNDSRETQNPATKRTLLWERWSGRRANASPFGICVRPVESHDAGPPFPSWEYRPTYLEEPLSICIGEAGLEEPMWVYLSFMQRVQREQHFIEHPIGLREITGLILTTPAPLRSEASQKMIEKGILETRVGAASLLEIEFDRKLRGQPMDFRPHLPFVFQL
jgi:hypothetical protein